IYLFGGTDGLNVFDDTWTWTGSSWIPLSPAHHPLARHRHAMGADPTGSLVRVAGGLGGAGQDLADTWDWNGNDWSAGPDLVRPGHDLVLAVDPLRNDPLAIGSQPSARVEMDVLTGNPAAALAYGQGCSGSLGVPHLRAAGRPYLGNATFRVHVGEVPAGALTGVLIDAAAAAIALPGGCTQLVAVPNALGLGVPNTAAFAGFPVPIPAGSALLGASFFTQGVALDPNGALQNLAALTGGLQLQLGH